MEKQYTPEEAEKLNAQLAIIAKQVRQLLDTHQYETAKKVLLEQALPLVPNHQIILSDLAYCEKQLGNHQASYDYLMQALAHHTIIDPEVYDSLTTICCTMKRFEEARYYAKTTLKRKKQILAEKPPIIYPIPQHKALGLSADKRKNIICFSLFGSLPRYCETAVLNVELAKQIYPEWTCRFYLDNSVPTDVVERLQNSGAEVIHVGDNPKISGLFWRFFIFDDPNVQCFIIRDADSMLSYKEKAAVDEWLKSGKWFHIMRDGIEHCELILAGMWGGYGGVLENIKTLAQNYYDDLPILNKTIDQHFLRTLYPTVAQSVLIHDNYLLDPDSQPFPDYELSDIEKIPYFHIGMIDSGIKTTTINIQDPSTKRVRWYLKNKHNDRFICSYEANCKKVKGQNIVQFNLPYFYSLQIVEGNWYLTYSILD